jgi:ABC-type nickel/cobalt efflux system permease component RcnA
MMVLSFTTASIAFIHTLFGPDHYLPFMVMGKARNWSLKKTALVTVVCGFGHIIGSIILGFVGIGFGIGLMRLELIEGFRGNLAAWALIGFGFMYFVWGIRKIVRNKPHKHSHVHIDKDDHTHTHTHTDQHVHIHDKRIGNMTPWVLFTIFVLGPCEPLIPLLMYPAAKNSLMALLMVVGIFGLVTISTMLGIVMIASSGVRLIPLRWLERYSHALAGAAICFCGVAIQFFGL